MAVMIFGGFGALSELRVGDIGGIFGVVIGNVQFAPGESVASVKL